MSGMMTHNAPRQSGMNGVLFLLALSVLINYIDRSNLSIAADLIKGELGLSDLQLGALLSAFFWTYGCMQIPAGWLVDRFDVKWVFAAGFFLWSLATAATGILHGFVALIAIRVILGFGESIAFPSYSNILCNHFTEGRRGSANAALIAGLALGPAIGMAVGGNIVSRFGWRPFFLVLGMGSLLWLLPWIKWMPSRTRTVARASEPKVTILDILRQRSAWGTCLGQFCINYCLYLLVTWMPVYLMRGRHFTMKGMAKAGGLIFLLDAVAAMTTGKISDRWIAAGASPTRVRKTFLGVGSTGLGVFLAVAALAPDSLIVAVLGVACMFLGMAGSNCWAVTQTVAGPRVAGRWAGVQNFVGNFAGAVAPTLTGFLLGRTGQFYWPLVIAGLISFIGAISWVFVVGPLEPVEWGRAPSTSSGITPPAANVSLP
jgi:ACS family D-galactonate transporter-like MFS transporter